MIRYYPLTGVAKTIVGGYGNRTTNGVTKLHDAVDLGAPTGTPVIAVDDGLVVHGTDPTGGNVAILHVGTTAYYHAHLLRTQSGSRNVKAGEQFAECDTTGNAALVGIPPCALPGLAGWHVPARHHSPRPYRRLDGRRSPLRSHRRRHHFESLTGRPRRLRLLCAGGPDLRGAVRLGAVAIVSLDFPATANTLWAGYVAGKLPRPEYLLPCLYSESGFSTSVTNSIGCTGLNQLCPFAWPIPAGYASWSASQQIAGPITSMFGQLIAKYGPLNSGTRTYLANFLPAYLPKATSLSSVLAVQGGAVYSANSGLDYQKKGAITVGDLSHFIARAAANTTVQSAIAQTYALAPGGVGPQQDPVFGTDFNASPSPFGLPLADLALAAAAALSLAGLGYLAWREYRQPGYLLPFRAATA